MSSTKQKAILYAGIICSALHAALVVFVLYAIVFATEQDWPMYWAIFLPIDFPYSLLVTVGQGVLPHHIALREPFGDVPNFILPFIILGIGGTIWWFFLPQWILRAALTLLRRVRRS